MPVKMECPHCKRALNVTEVAFGKTAPCPGCKQPITVPASPTNRSGVPPPIPDSEVGPLWEIQPTRFARLKKPAIVVGAVGGGLILFGLLWKLLAVTASASGLLGSGYQADYKVVHDERHAGLEVTVRGKDAKLAVILTDPNAESNTKIIKSEDMITNSATVKLWMEHPQTGTYVLTVKTFDPEAVVVTKYVKFAINRLTVEDVKFHLASGRLTGEFTLKGLEITLRKDGNLPVEITDVLFPVANSKVFTPAEILGCRIMADQKHTVSAIISPLPPTSFRSGNRYLIKGILCFGNLKKPLEFEKELVVSQDLVNEAKEQEMKTRIRQPSF